MTPTSQAGGALFFIAPEIIISGGAECPADLWSLGVCTFILLCGYCPFSRVEDGALLLDLLEADILGAPVEPTAKTTLGAPKS